MDDLDKALEDFVVGLTGPYCKGCGTNWNGGKICGALHRPIEELTPSICAQANPDCEVDGLACVYPNCRCFAKKQELPKAEARPVPWWKRIKTWIYEKIARI